MSPISGCSVELPAWLQPPVDAACLSVRMPDDIQELVQRRMFDQALERLLDEYQHKVFRMAVAMLRDRGRAEEVTQEIFLKVWRALPSYSGRAAASTWLYAIARNTCLNAVRAESYRKTTPIEQLPEPEAPRVTSPDFEWGPLLARLPEMQRQVVMLFYFEDRDVKEVGRLLGLAEGTVKSHLHRARYALARMLE